MPQTDGLIENADGASFRADINAAIAALLSNNSGASEPATKYAYQWWYDTANDLLKIRNAGNDAWIIVRAFDQTLDLSDFSTDISVTSTASGSSQGPTLKLRRLKALAAAASDFLGAFAFEFKNSAGTITTAGKLHAQVVDPTAGSEDGRWRFEAIVAGALHVALFVGDGCYTFNAVGGDKGSDTINANKLHVGAPFWSSGTGSPESVVSAPIGSLYSRLDGGATTSLYVKTSGSGTTGWTGK